MSVSSITQLGESGFSDILSKAQNLLEHGYDETRSSFPENVLMGLIQRNLSDLDMMVAETTAARLGSALVKHRWPVDFTLSEAQILDEFSGFSRSVDLLLAAYTDDLTFGKGRELMSRFSEVSTVHLISLRDDIYAHPAALSHLLAFNSQLPDLRGKRIAISWAFGQKLSLPRIPHSLLRIAPTLGINIRVVAPKKFQLLKRVFKDVAAHASSLGTETEQSEEFESSFKDCDAVYTMPWIRFDNYLHPERNLEDAREFKDWYFTEETLPDKCVFSTDTPIQSELTISHALKKKWNPILQQWLARKTAVLAAMMTYVLSVKYDYPIVLI